MDVRFWAATDVGRTRDHNEDNFLVDKKLNLFIVADGMGGHAAGEVASSIAVREVRRVIAEEREVIESFIENEEGRGREDVLSLIERSIKIACARVFEMAQENVDRRGMGTTLSMMLVAGRRGFIGHVGDSRIYLTRGPEVHQLTEDHSLVNELIKRGRLKPGDAFDSPYKNAVTRAVGVYETVEVDTFDFDVLPGDNYLICSDGLSCYIDDPITMEILGGADIKAIPERFIELANDSGGKDNITAIVVRAQPVEEIAPDQVSRVNEVRHKLDTLRAIPLFKYLSYKGLVKVMNITESRHFEPGEIIFAEDSRGDAFFIILDGRVLLSKCGVSLAELDGGSHFGEMAMVDKAPRSATATALDTVRTLTVERSSFYELMRRDPVLSVKLMWSFLQALNTRLRVTNRELLASHETITILRRHQVGGVIAEMPALNPGLSAVASLPMGETDELIPGFLLAESETSGTDPFIRVQQDSALEHDDLDERPGLASEPPTSVDPPSPAEPDVEDLIATTELPRVIVDQAAASTEPGPTTTSADPDQVADSAEPDKASENGPDESA